jgi:hypothetical protein
VGDTACLRKNFETDVLVDFEFLKSNYRQSCFEFSEGKRVEFEEDQRRGVKTVKFRVNK